MVLKLLRLESKPVRLVVCCIRIGNSQQCNGAELQMHVVKKVKMTQKLLQSQGQSRLIASEYPSVPCGEWHRGEGAVAILGGGDDEHETPRDADKVCEKV